LLDVRRNFSDCFEQAAGNQELAVCRNGGQALLRVRRDFLLRIFLFRILLGHIIFLLRILLGGR
jgi:hypothetical protein